MSPELCVWRCGGFMAKLLCSPREGRTVDSLRYMPQGRWRSVYHVALAATVAFLQSQGTFCSDLRFDFEPPRFRYLPVR